MANLPSRIRTHDKNDATSLHDIAKKYFAEPDPAKRVDNMSVRMVDEIIQAYFAVRKDSLVESIENSAQRAADLSESTNAARTEVAELRTRLNKFRDEVSKPEEALEGFKAAIGEQIRLSDAGKLWNHAARDARTAYGISWILLGALLIVGPLVTIWQADTIGTFLHEIGAGIVKDIPNDAAATAALILAVSRLVLVSLPIALYIWLIRILVRFNVRSLLLMDDANQRTTMLKTYLYLVEQNAEMKGDRALILEALFRRAPGHGPDTIEAPNLADILKIQTPGAK